MNKGKIILGALTLLVAFMAPATVAKAGDGGLNTVHLSFCEMEFFFGTDHYPNLYFDSVDVYDSGGAFVENINLYGHNAESRNVGYTIGRLVGHWGHPAYGVTEHKRADTPSCAMHKLIDMYVYFSPNPFFGNTHTMTIYSARGFPSKEIVTALAGGRLPDEFRIRGSGLLGRVVRQRYRQGIVRMRRIPCKRG